MVSGSPSVLSMINTCLKLMADHDLRALDMRHTLPNIKNLLLTLTSGETEPQR